MGFMNRKMYEDAVEENNQLYKDGLISLTELAVILRDVTDSYLESSQKRAIEDLETMGYSVELKSASDLSIVKRHRF